ncbi:hypothetical protein [uncultured Sphingomonas sp.]|uniref:hypothetical protein n=1 Tax=uncultured Sphingomonas sp. TaxID=158754 RepID=UPI0025EF0F1D|nr:hypothetical protein [uncultured Sphingomonas sp.]
MILAAAFAVMAQASQPVAVPADAATTGIAAALQTCEVWLMRPATWAGSIDGFPDKAGLTGRIVARPSIPDAVTPPAGWLPAPHYWYAGAGPGGLFVTVSDTRPLCHVIGGSSEDLQPAVEAVLAQSGFKTSWSAREDKSNGDMRTTRYVSTVDPHVWMMVSRAAKPGERRDRPQIAITAQMDVER